MHATSLQTLVMLVAQAAPGGDFQPTNDKLDIPDLLAPSAQTAPEKTAPAAPADSQDRSTEPAPKLPETRLPPKDDTSQATPSDFVPPNNKSAPTPASNLASPVRLDNAENSQSVIPETTSGDGPSGQFRTTNQAERAASPIYRNPARTLAVSPNRTPWEVTETLIEEAVKLPSDSTESSGRPISLQQALAGTSNRDERIAVIKTYWQLAVAIADWNHAQDEVQRLTGLPDPLSELEAAQLSSAVVTASARLSETKLVLLSTQHELAANMKSDSSSLPLTSDIPFVGAYEPKFDEIFSGRPAPRNLRRLAESFPLYLELTNARARSVLGTEATLTKLAEAYPQGNVAYAQILDAFNKLRDQRIALLATVRDYNNAIADYSLNTINVGLNSAAVVATLIETEPVSSVLVSPSGVRPASGVAPIRTAGQPTPAAQPAQPPAAPTQLVPVEQPGTQFVPRQVRPTVPSQPAPLAPIADPATSGSGFRR